MTSWFRSVEDFLETVDRTAANVAVIRDRSHAEKTSKSVDDHLAALEPAGIRRPGASSVLKEKSGSKAPGNVAKGSSIESNAKAPGVDNFEQPLEIALEVNNIPSIENGTLAKAAVFPPPQSLAIEKSLQSGQEVSKTKVVVIPEANATAALPDMHGGSENGVDVAEEQTLVAVSNESHGLGLTEEKTSEQTTANGSSNNLVDMDSVVDSPGGVTNASVTALSPESCDLPVSRNGAFSPKGSPRAEPNGFVTDRQQEVHEPKGEVKGELLVGGFQPAEQATETPKIPKTLAVQRELDEARGLLKHATSAGQSKEARLARICSSLSQRLQEYKAENAQLEELLRAERDGRGSMDSTVKGLQQQLAQLQAELVVSEASTANALSAKNAELETLTLALSESKRQAALLEGKLASLQANTEVITKNRDATEARMIQALREELSAAERRFEDERAAHAATRQTGAERELELEQRVTESASGLIRMQRAIDERTQKALDLEEKVSLLEVECATLSQELQAADARLKREHKRPSDEHSVAAQVLAWREETERARNLQHEAENKLAAMEAEAQKLRVELEARKREVDSSSMQAHAELEKRFRELTELLYLKQTQLENMASEKQAVFLQLEKETRRFREVKAQAERDNRAMRRLVMTTDDEDPDLSPFESFGMHQRRVSPSIQQAAKLLDRGAVTAGKFLWRRPLARLALLFYLLFVHLFLMYLLHRLQALADELINCDNKIMSGSELLKMSSKFQ